MPKPQSVLGDPKQGRIASYSNQPTKPGDCVSVDQMISSTPGFIAQMTGRLTTKRYKCATVYVDHVSRCGCVHLQQSTSAEDTLKGKEAFEELCRKQGFEVKAYHADNGIFKANKWVDDCKNKRQGLTFAGVNAHHQNGIAERRIRSLQELARAMMIHAKHRWPKAVEANLWPCAVRMASNIMNETPNLQHEKKLSPSQVFTNTNININPKHIKPFGCPVYVLDNALQQGNIHHKWKERSRIGLYLGPSPRHGRQVGLVLDLMTGLVSPQFHITHDSSFHAIKQEDIESKWQIKAGFASALTNQTAKRKQATTHASNRKKLKRVIRDQEGDTAHSPEQPQHDGVPVQSQDQTPDEPVGEGTNDRPDPPEHMQQDMGGYLDNLKGYCMQWPLSYCHNLMMR